MGDAGDPALLALVAEACRRSKLVWISVLGRRPAPAWHVWLDGAAYVVHGRAEQPLPDLDSGATTALVTVRSKDKGGRLVTWAAQVTDLAVGSPEWDAAVAALHTERLNARDGEEQPARWARECRITRLQPTGEVREAPGAMPEDSGASPPPPTPATTRGPLPFVVGPRARRR
jgi:hypothetical protein